MTRLHDLYEQQGQSVWLDNLSRGHLRDGTLQRMVNNGVRGVTSNPTIFQKAIGSGNDYDEQLASLADREVEDAYWAAVMADIRDALGVLRPVFDASDGTDGFVSLEVAPAVAADTNATEEMARYFHQTVEEPNLMVKIPATDAGVPAIELMISEGRNINITLIFSIERYAQVIEAYLSGLERCAGDLSGISSVASFFVSRVDTEVDRRLDEIGSPEALELRGKAAVAQAQLAYQLFLDRFSGERWQRLADRGARVQRPLWASTSTKNPDYPELLYVDSLIGPDTVNTMPDATLEAFMQKGNVARTVDEDPAGARKVFDDLARVGIDMAEVSAVLEEQGVASFSKSFDELISALEAKRAGIGSPG